MTAIQLNAALHKELSFIVTDNSMMEQALKSLRKIKRDYKSQNSKEKIKENLKHAFVEYKLAKEQKVQTRDLIDVLNEL